MFNAVPIQPCKKGFENKRALSFASFSLSDFFMFYFKVVQGVHFKTAIQTSQTEPYIMNVYTQP